MPFYGRLAEPTAPELSKVLVRKRQSAKESPIDRVNGETISPRQLVNVVSV